MEGKFQKYIFYIDILVPPGEYIMCWGGYTEMVDEVYSDGSFTTEYLSESYQSVEEGTTLKALETMQI